MKIKLYDDNRFSKIPPKVQVCLNRGIKIDKIPSYLTNTFEHINPAEAFDESLLKQAATRLITTISANKKAFVIVDSDCDGWTSAAHLINYLYEAFPTWTKTKLEYGLHEGKQHGINDLLDILLDREYSLLLVPDAGTNDIEAIKKLHEHGCETIILDHHISDVGFSEYAITINSQYNYPNPFLSGVGVVHKFCEYLDKLLNKNYADKFLDLTSIGMMGDMMNITSLETKEMIFQGLQDDNLHNPLILGLIEKSNFALSKADYAPSPQNNLRITPMGAAFFIIPLLNALSRSGTLEEKELVFESMLTMKAFDEILSNKRGHKLGEMEQRVTQALRTCTNVKNRQTRAEDAGMELLTAQAEERLDDKVLVFCLEPGQINPNIAGLVANKLASKYQRPVCVTTHINIPKDENDEEREASCGPDYAGSMRGYTATGIDDFKKVAESSGSCRWCRGHENSAGICLTDPMSFINDMNSALKDISSEIVYYVDYSWNANEVDGEAIISMAEMNDYLGTGFNRPLVHIHDFIVNSDNFKVMKGNTLKFTLPNGIDIIKFGGTDEEIEKFTNITTTIELVARCNINEWNWQRNPQLIMESYEEMEKVYTVLDWGF